VDSPHDLPPRYYLGHKLKEKKKLDFGRTEKEVAAGRDRCSETLLAGQEVPPKRRKERWKRGLSYCGKGGGENVSPHSDSRPRKSTGRRIR